MNETRVMITGYGTMLSGNEPDQVNSAAMANEERDGEMPAAAVRRITNLDAESHIAEKELRRMDRLSQFAMLSTLQCVEHAQLNIKECDASRVGLVFNSCFGPLESTTKYLNKLLTQGPKYAPAGLFPFTVAGVFAGLVTMHLQALGTNSTISGASSVRYGLDAIRQNTDDVMFVGGCDENIPEITTWCEQQRQAGNRFFSVGEGSATLLLETEAHAQARGANVIAEILEAVVVHDAALDSPYRAGADSIEYVIRQSSAASGVEIDQIDFVVSAANGIESLRASEAIAIERVFSVGEPMPVIHPETNHGETFGASGVIASIRAAELLHARKYQSKAASASGTAANYALVLSYEFGGNIEGMVVHRYE